MNESDGRFHDANGIVDVLLNQQSENVGYAMRWDHNLMLRRPITISVGGSLRKVLKGLSGAALKDTDFPVELFEYHLIPSGFTPSPINEIKKTTVIEDDIELIPYILISIAGIIEDRIYIEADGMTHKLDDSVRLLKPYLESDEYAVGDSELNTVLKGDTVLSRNFEIVVMERHRVKVEFDEKIRVSDISETVIASEISDLTGIEQSRIIVEVEGDSEGFVVRVIITLPDEEKGMTVVDRLNNIQNDDHCQSGVFCRNHKASLLTADETLSKSDHVIESRFVTWCFVLFMTRMLL